MFTPPIGRIFAGIASLMFLVAAVSLVRIAFQVQYGDGNYALFYFGFGVWLECIYLAIHFLLLVVFRSRLKLAGTVSQVLALLTFLPITLIVLIEGLLLGQYIDFNFRGNHESQVEAWVVAVLVLLLLVIPALFMFRFGVGLFFPRHAQHGDS